MPANLTLPPHGLVVPISVTVTEDGSGSFTVALTTEPSVSVVDKPPVFTGSTVAAGNGFSCGVRVDGTLVCWGSDAGGAASAPAGEFVAVSAGRAHSCGVQADGAAVCWGAGDEVVVPAGTVLALPPVPPVLEVVMISVREPPRRVVSLRFRRDQFIRAGSR